MTVKNYLVVGQKWNKNRHGISISEINRHPSNYNFAFMSKKYFLIYKEEDVDEFYINKTPDLKDTEFIIINKIYRYSHRLFVKKNNHFYNFIKKCKHYYSNKINQRKNPKQLFKRQIYGRYKRCI
tara:strand:+ start:118 stop:492 length:375 start_codon:yes stop_codon:yes gene_type:complete